MTHPLAQGGLITLTISKPIKGLLASLLIMFGISHSYASAFYNLTQYDIDAGNRISLPAHWSPDPGSVPYAGALDAYWLARMTSDQEVVEISRNNARDQGLPDNYSLTTAPDNCWGMDMGFGLVTLLQAANLSITVTGNQSAVMPAFALYKGWDTSKTSSRHAKIYFGSDNPLGTNGLQFLGDRLVYQAGGEAVRTFENLPAGNYEIFVTVASNQSISGEYKVLLQTTPVGSPDNPKVNGVCGLAANTLSPVSPAKQDLCATGVPGPLKRLANSRYEWLCNGLQTESSGQRCYSLGNGRKLNQAPLVLWPGNVMVKAGHSVHENAEGGSGTGKMSFAKRSASKGTRCQLKVKKSQVEIKTKGKPGQCEVTASRAASTGFNKVESYPVVIRVEP